MPKPDHIKRKQTRYNPNSGAKRTQTSDVDQSHGNRHTLERREADRLEKQYKQSSKIDRERRQTDTGHSKRRAANKRERINNNLDYYSNSASKRERYTDTGSSKRKEVARKNRINSNTADYVKRASKVSQYTDAASGRSAKKTYGNAESTKRAMKEKHGNSRSKPSLYDRADYKGQEIERKVKRKWKPSDTPSQRPDETGREWGNHKYIDKVKTKSGKIRYIYEIEGGGSKQQDAGKTMRQNNNSKSASQKNYNLAPARKVAKSAKAFLKGLFS